MLIAYNLFQLLLLPAFLLIGLPILLSKKKYRSRLGSRLGFGLRDKLSRSADDTSGPTYWIHALSVGEVTSAVPLVAGLRQSRPESRIIVSVSTSSGRNVADKLLTDIADHVIDGPMDFYPVVSHFLQLIQCDCFILIETDFWPNLLLQMRRRNIAAILVNGRVSAKSMQQYRRFSLFFQPMFASLTALCMQTEHDRKQFAALGLAPEHLFTLGNLKFDQPPTTSKLLPELQQIYGNSATLTIIGGSTHEGEDEILLKTYLSLRSAYPKLRLFLAPRSISRADEIELIARRHGLTVARRSAPRYDNENVLLIDTIGELSCFYGLADIAYVGGSLVPAGGHNPIEPSRFGIPVIFGNHMEDFREIAAMMVEREAAMMVADDSQLEAALTALLANPEERRRRGTAGKECIAMAQGVVARHIALINQYMNRSVNRSVNELAN